MRQVQFDPYGSYTEGLDRGMSRQMELEQQSRANRQTDWEYNNVNPYNLNRLERNDKLGAAAYPYQINAMKYADSEGRDKSFASRYGTELNLAGDYPGMSGVAGSTVAQYGHIQYQQDPSQPAYTHYWVPDQNGNLQYGGTVGTDVLPHIAKHIADLNDFYKTQTAQAGINATNGMADYHYNRGQYYAPGGVGQGSMAAKEKLMAAQAAHQQAQAEYEQELAREKQQANVQGTAQGNSYTNTGATQALPPPDLSDYMPETP